MQDEFVRDLLCEILTRAVEDCRFAILEPERKDRHQFSEKELDEFFNSEWFEDICASLHINKKCFLARLETVKQKAREMAGLQKSETD